MEDHVVDEMEGIEITGAEQQIPLMTEDERRVLEVYDRLDELQLEIALLKAQGVLSQGDVPAELTEEDISTAQDELLKAKATYQIRSKVIENVLIANPIIKAVHAGQNGSAVEQDLLPLIQKRDRLSITLTALSKNVLYAKNELVQAQTENILIGHKNAELASTMLALAGEANTRKKEDIEDPKTLQRLDHLEAAMKLSRQKWRIMKGTASAVIAGSGVDWARHPTLLQIVLDDEG